MQNMELLAPRGQHGAPFTLPCVLGADAVYLGLESFNARRGADNFTIATLKEACDYAHLRGVKIYVTLNIIVLPGEVGRALECARQAWRAGADALIIQDIGLASEIARALPDIRLHVSTQMNTCNAAGIRAAAAWAPSVSRSPASFPWRKSPISRRWVPRRASKSRRSAMARCASAIPASASCPP